MYNFNFKVIIAILFFLEIVSRPVKCIADDLATLFIKAEQIYGIPQGLLAAIANVESGSRKYALNINGKAFIAVSKEEAVEVIQHYLKQGNNIDIGIMQINLRWHGQKFKSLTEMLEPKMNVEYAAQHLRSLYEQYGSWNEAVRYYHSAKPLYYSRYAQKVLITWLNN